MTRKNGRVSRSRWARIGHVALLCLVVSGLAGAGGKKAKLQDERVQWLAGHVVPLRSIDPRDEDFSDLLPLARAIGAARIVQLGENTHGDGATFLAKARLVRFLHQVLGFDVLAWEAGFFDCRLLDAALASSMPLPQAAGQALYKLWADSAEVMPVLEYVRSTKSTPLPLTLAGFDSRVSTAACRERLFPESILAFFDRLDPEILSAKDREDFRTMSVRLVPLDYYEHPELRSFNTEPAERLLATLDRGRERMLAFAAPREIDFVRQALVSTLNMARALREADLSEEGTEDPERDRFTRDAAMAENILWLYRNRFPGSKMIVWAHNYHVAEDLQAAGLPAAALEKLQQRKYAGPHGRFLRRELGDEVYTIAFGGYQGTWGYVNEKREALPAAEPDSLDGLLHRAGKPLAFLDLRGLEPGHWLRQPLPARFSFWEAQVLDWPRLFDGVLFIDQMTPSTPVAKE